MTRILYFTKIWSLALQLCLCLDVLFLRKKANRLNSLFRIIYNLKESQTNICPLDQHKAHLGHQLDQALLQWVPALLEKEALRPQLQVGHSGLW